MKWKSTLTADEAVLFAVGIEGYKSLKDASDEALFPDGVWEREGSEQDEFVSKVRTAEEIYEALLDDIALADPYYLPPENMLTTYLDIAMRAQVSEYEDYLVPEKCKLTKLSLAKWFWQHDHDIARKFWPSICEEIVHPPQQKQVKSSVDSEPGPKGRNSYLRTIAALSEALIDGLTGQPNPDAAAVLSALASKGIETPIKEEALSNYLSEAAKLR